MKRLLLLSLVLSCASVEAVDVPANTVSVELGKGNTLTVTRRKGNTSKTVAVTVNKDDKVTIVAPPPVMHQGQQPNLEGLWPMSPGTDEFRVRPTTEVAPVSGDGTGSGAFRVVGDVVAVDFFDPIVSPGQKVAHLHMFICNASINPDSTEASLKAGKSACRGGIANRSSYWIPAMLDDTLKPVKPTTWLTYYKGGTLGGGYGWTGADGVKHPALNPDGTLKFPGLTNLPNGLKLIAGDPTRTTPRLSSDPFSYRWNCRSPEGVNNFGAQMPDSCAAGWQLGLEIFMPQCWDGKNLDSPNHKAHMSYPVVVKNYLEDGKPDPRGWSHSECPATHPVVIPEVSYSITWLIPSGANAAKWSLSSDNPVLYPRGVTAHGDLWVMWDEGIKKAWFDNCVNGKPAKDCHAHLLGDGREIYGPP